MTPLAPLGRRGRDGEPLPAAAATPVRTASTSRPAAVAEPIQIAGRYVSRWREGAVEACLVRGDCVLKHGDVQVTSREMVIWQQPVASGEQSAVVVAAYFEGDVRREQNGQVENLGAAFVERTAAAAEVAPGYVSELNAPPADAVLQRARERRSAEPGGMQLQHIALQPGLQPIPQGQPGPLLTPFADPVPGAPPAGNGFAAPMMTPKHVAIYPRNLGEGFSLLTRPSVDTIPREFITTVTGGVRIVVDGTPVEVNGQVFLTTIDLAADRAVIWTDAERVNEFSTNFDLDGQTPFEVYLEGNIEVRQGNSVLHATHAFYDLNEERGQLWNGELRTYLPGVDATVRLRAAQIRQQSNDRFHARDAWITTSEMGDPGYRIQASDIFLERRPFGGRPGAAPEDGTLWVTSLNNKLYVENVPIAAAPYLSSPAEDPEIALRKLSFGYDNVFGFQAETVFDAEALFGVNLPDGIEWDLKGDYFSKRGPALGTDLRHDGYVHVFGVTGRARGESNFYYIYDEGEDRLGLGRNNLPVPDPHRGRALWRHRTDFPFGITTQSEFGFLSDRNVREQYWESDWDTGKDYESLTQIQHQHDNLTASLLFRGKPNDFENTTLWLPRVDLTVLGEPVGTSPLLWSMHSMAGYGHLKPAEPPFNPAVDPFAPLPYFVDSEGVVAMSRHELSLPLHAGPVNIVPYALGEAAFWNEDMTGSELARFYGSAGVRGSVMFSKYMPGVYSPILGLNGLAHKMVFDVDYSYSEASEPLGAIPQYNEFDEDAQERFRSRFILNEFGGALPAEFDPRFYAVRSGAGNRVTSPYHELVDDMHVVRMGWRHRWQTRAGTPQAPRIYDWMTLDLEASLFPQADRDNFGEEFGLLSARYAWNVGPRTKFLANTIFDVFDPGQQVWNAGILTQRGGRGSVYVGFRGIQAGSIDSELLVASASYHPSEKWAWTVGTSFDVAEGVDRGQSATVTRIGEYLLFHVGAGYDRSRESWGVGVSIEPKFGGYRPGSTQLSSLLGVPQ